MEGEIGALDALYPTIRVSSDDEEQQTHHRMPAMHKITYQEDMQNKSCAKNVMILALHHQNDIMHIMGLALMAGTCTKSRCQRRSR